MEEFLKELGLDSEVVSKIVAEHNKTEAIVNGLEKNLKEKTASVEALTASLNETKSKYIEADKAVSLVKTVLNLDEVTSEALLAIEKTANDKDQVQNLLNENNSLKEEKEALARKYDENLINLKKEGILKDAIATLSEKVVIKDDYHKKGILLELSDKIGYVDGKFGKTRDAGSGNIIIDGTVEDVVESLIKDGGLEPKSEGGQGGGKPNFGNKVEEPKKTGNDLLDRASKFNLKI